MIQMAMNLILSDHEGLLNCSTVGIYNRSLLQKQSIRLNTHEHDYVTVITIVITVT